VAGRLRSVRRLRIQRCQPSVNMSRINRNIIGKNRSKRNTGFFWSDTRSPSMNGMFGIDGAGWSAPSGLDSFYMADPGRCPGLEWHCPVGAREQATPKAPTGRPYRKGRAFFPTCPNWNARRHELRFSKAPTGRHHPSPGQRPGFRITPPIPAPTGRPNRNGGDTRSPSMNGMFAIDATGWFAPSGLDSFSMG
jgi:hypothetical protein